MIVPILLWAVALLGCGTGLGWWLRGLQDEPVISDYRDALIELAAIRLRLERNNIRLASQRDVAELRYEQAAGFPIVALYDHERDGDR